MQHHPHPPRFQPPLSDAEALVLRSFADHSPIAYPADCGGLSSQQIADALRSLKARDLVKRATPLSLTKKGKQLLSQLTKQTDNQDDQPSSAPPAS